MAGHQPLERRGILPQLEGIEQLTLIASSGIFLLTAHYTCLKSGLGHGVYVPQSGANLNSIAKCDHLITNPGLYLVRQEPMGSGTTLGRGFGCGRLSATGAPSLLTLCSSIAHIDSQ